MEEISLRDLIKIFLKGKWVISSFTAVAVLLAAVYSFFIAPPVYETKGTMIVAPVGLIGGVPVSTQINAPVGEENDSSRESVAEVAEDLIILNRVNAVVASFARDPRMNIDAYLEELKSPYMMEAVAKQLNLPLGWKQLQGLVTVESKKLADNKTDSGYINIKVKYKDPETAVKIVDAIYNEFNARITKRVEENTDRVINFVTEQKNKEKEKYNLLMEELAKVAPQTAEAAGGDYAELKHKAQMSKETIDAYRHELSDIMVQQQANMSRPNVQLAVEPIKPLEPVGPRKVLNMAIAAVLGVMMSTFFVFFKDYWEKSEATADKIAF